MKQDAMMRSSLQCTMPLVMEWDPQLCSVLCIVLCTVLCAVLSSLQCKPPWHCTALHSSAERRSMNTRGML